MDVCNGRVRIRKWFGGNMLVRKGQSDRLTAESSRAKPMSLPCSPRLSMQHFYTDIIAALDAGEPFALGIISGIKGSSPQKQGAKALFFADGRIVGTLGGGCLEAEIQDRARRALLTGSRPRSIWCSITTSAGTTD